MVPFFQLSQTLPWKEKTQSTDHDHSVLNHWWIHHGISLQEGCLSIYMSFYEIINWLHGKTFIVDSNGLFGLHSLTLAYYKCCSSYLNTTLMRKALNLCVIPLGLRTADISWFTLTVKVWEVTTCHFTLWLCSLALLSLLECSVLLASSWVGGPLAFESVQIELSSALLVLAVVKVFHSEGHYDNSIPILPILL